MFTAYNCTFFGNSAIDIAGTSGIGGGADALGVDANGGHDFVNCIFRGNVAESGNVALDNLNAVPSQIPATYCCIEDETADDSVFIFAGNGNIDSNPMFTDENATPPQLGLRITSPCIDAGNTFPVPTDQFNVDAAVFPGDAPDTNVNEFTPDLLLHRRVVDVASVANTGEGDDCGVVDMGSLEHITHGDMNGDGARDGRDIQPFCDCWVAASITGICAPADLTGDGLLTFADVTCLIAVLLDQPSCFSDCPQDFGGGGFAGGAGGAGGEMQMMGGGGQNGGTQSAPQREGGDDQEVEDPAFNARWSAFIEWLDANWIDQYPELTEEEWNDIATNKMVEIVYEGVSPW